MGKGMGRAFVSALVVCLVAGASVCIGADGPQGKLPFASPNTIVAVRLKSVDQGMKAVVGLVTQFDANAGKEAEQGMNDGLQALRGLDKAGPAAVLVLDPKKFGDPVVGVVTLADADQFKAIEMATAQVVGKLGILGENKDAVAEVAKALADGGLNAIPTGDMSDMLVVNADVGALVARYKADIQGGLQLMKMRLGGGGGMEDPAAKPDATKQMALKAIDYLGKLVGELEKQAGAVQLGLTIDNAQITMKGYVEAKPGSAFATYLRNNNRPLNPTLAKYLPKEAFITSVSTGDPASNLELMQGLLKVGCDIAGLSAEETAAIAKVVEGWGRNATGLNATAQVMSKDGPGNVALYGINDPDVARASLKAAVGQMGAGTVGEFLKKYGLTATLTEKHREYKDIPIDKLEVAVDIDKLTGALPLPAEVAPMLKMQLSQMFKLGYGAENKVTVELVHGKKLLVSTYGAAYEKLTEKQIDLMKGGGADGIGTTAEYQAAIARHPKSAVSFGHMSLFGYCEVIGKMMQKMGGMPMPMGPEGGFIPTRAELPAEEVPVSFSMSIEDNRALVSVHVPVKPIKDIVDVAKKKFTQMMEGMKRNVPPMPPNPAPMP